MTDAKLELLSRAKEAALWMLEREDNPPAMKEYVNSFRFIVDGLQFEYRPRGRHYDDNPFRIRNLEMIEHDEGLVLVAKCPRHGGERTSGIIPTLSPDAAKMLSQRAKLIGALVSCSLCWKKKTVVVRVPGWHLAGGGYRLAADYCARCADRRFHIPKSAWLKEPPRYAKEEFRTEEDVRESTRRVLAEIKQWAQDVECDRCVALMWAAASGWCTGVGGTYSTLHRTYVR